MPNFMTPIEWRFNMAGSRVAALLADMPQKERNLVSRTVDRLEKLESDIEDEILTIARVHMFGGSPGSLSVSSGSLVVTPLRLIVLEQQGGAVVLPFSEIQQIGLVGVARSFSVAMKIPILSSRSAMMAGALNGKSAKILIGLTLAQRSCSLHTKATCSREVSTPTVDRDLHGPLACRW
jgi:hypothetical protein